MESTCQAGNKTVDHYSRYRPLIHLDIQQKARLECMITLQFQHTYDVLYNVV